MDVQAFNTERPLLHTERLILRPFDEADAPAVQALAGAREIADTTLHIPHPYPPGAAAAWIATHAGTWESATGETCAIVSRDEGSLVGAIGLAINGPHASGELGYWIGVPHWNRGYATEAARAMLALAFGSLRLNRVHAHHLTRNPSSGRVMQKIGMQLEGVHRQAVRKWDRFEDIAVYAILASDWLAKLRVRCPDADARTQEP